jgi:hypothetical protein
MVLHEAENYEHEADSEDESDSRCDERDEKGGQAEMWPPGTCPLAWLAVTDLRWPGEPFAQCRLASPTVCARRSTAWIDDYQELRVLLVVLKVFWPARCRWLVYERWLR